MMLMVSPSRLRVMNGRQDRERDGHRDDEGAPPASEEEQDHHGGETGGDHRLPDHPANGRPHEDGLVGERLDLDLRRKGRHHAGQARADPGRDVERGRRAGLQNSDEGAPAAIPPDDVRLGREPIAHLGDVPEVDRRISDHLDRQVVQLGDGPGAAVHGDVVFELADLRCAGRQHDVLLAEGRHDVGGGEPFRLEQALIQVDHDLALLAAVRVRDRGARDGHELGPQEVEADVVELRLGESRQGELENGHRRRAVVDDQGRLDAGRELAQDGLRHRRHLRVGGVEVRIRLQEDLDHRLAVHRRRFDVLDVVDGRRQDSLVLCRDPSFHLFRIEAGELPGHRDHRDVDAREYVGGRAEEDHRARDEDEQGEHDEGVGTVESDPDDPHTSAMASDQVVPLHRLQTAESAGRLQQPERAAVTHERGHAPGWRHEAGTGTHASGQLPTLG